MKLLVFALCFLWLCGSAHAELMGLQSTAGAVAWKPSWLRNAKPIDWKQTAGHEQVPLWPGTPPDAQPVPAAESAVLMTRRLIAGRSWVGVINVARPTMTVYPPKSTSTGAAVVVFPGGGFQMLAIDLEGTEVCHWLTSIGVTCVLVKYRVPSAPYRWECDCYLDDGMAESKPALEDAERAIRLVRFRAAQWHINPHEVGVLGFSAGGFLVAELSTRFNLRLYAPLDAADRESCRPDFALAIYPGHLENAGALNPFLAISRNTPPTFLVQAEDDSEDGVSQSVVYYAALAKAGVPAEMHLYAHGGHAFGLRSTRLPITHWPQLADRWLHSIDVNIIDREAGRRSLTERRSRRRAAETRYLIKRRSSGRLSPQENVADLHFM